MYNKSPNVLLLWCLVIGILCSCQNEIEEIKTTSDSSSKPSSLTSEDGVQSAAVGITYYVNASTGVDDASRSGTDPSKPWRTIQYGINRMTPGCTLQIASGTYQEKVVVSSTKNGTSSNYTVIKGADGATATLQGNTTTNRWESLFNLESVSYVRVENLKAQNGGWYGFSAYRSSNFKFEKCTTYDTKASGIYVSGSSNFTIHNNKIQKACQEPNRDSKGNGSQECITVATSNTFTVSNNEVWDTTFDGCGGEGIDTKGGCYNGTVCNNYLHDLYRVGIYMDAGSGTASNIRIHSNKVYRCGKGVAVAGELGGTSRNIYIYNNVLSGSRGCGVEFLELGNGKFIDVYVTNNTLHNNANSGWAGDIANYSKNTANSNIVIRNNIVYNKVANSRFSIWHNVKASHIISHNLFFDFKPSNNGSNSFVSSDLINSKTGQDPLFSNAGGYNFFLQSGSPAINAATKIYQPGSSTALLYTTDYYGSARGSSWDMGAYENNPN